LRAIVNTGPGKLELRELPVPEPGPGEVRIRTAFCGICATDLQMIAGWDRTGFPAIPCHEWSGTVDKTGDGVGRALAGARCVAENVFPDGREVGFELPGGYAEFFLTRAENVHALPPGFPLDDAALIEPLAVCVRGMRRLGGGIPSSALVLGDGPIGLLMTALLKRAGAGKIVVAGGRRERLDLGHKLGADQIANYHQESLPGSKYPVVVEATGSSDALRQALESVENTGRILILGDYGSGKADFPWNSILHREMTLIGSNASANAWPEAVRLAVSGEVTLKALISHLLPAERFPEGIALASDRSSGAVKVLLEWKRPG
jgi:2-desacetyl-2-hydroxyethyl bacteriochlorophyllide A dehydrogenase